MDQWDRTESLETDPHPYGQLISNKGSKIYNMRKTVSSASSVRKFQSQYPKAIEIKTKNKQMGPNQTYKLFYSKMKRIINKNFNNQNEKTMKRLREIFANDVTDKGLISKIHI